MAIVGTVVSAGLYLLDLREWLVFGIFAATMEIVPYAGPLVAVLGPFLACALDHDWGRAAAVVTLYFGVQIVMTDVVTPYLVKRRTEIPASLALTSILVLGATAGALGIVAAVPLVAIALAAFHTLPDRVAEFAEVRR
jgi:predicted PurR-regulated permease PerM